MKQFNNYEINEFRNFFNKIRNNNYFGRLGKTFSTTKNNYFLDTGTGKVAQINNNLHKVLKCLLETDNFDSIFSLDLSEQELINVFRELKKAVEKENILAAPPVKNLTTYSEQELINMFSNEATTIILEITEKCNLRCKYCVYNESHPEYREFGHRSMTFETAKKAVDFLNMHSNKNKEIFIGFYGGEPLLNFEVVKKTIEYANKTIRNKNIIYNMTTNATLLTADIAKFLVENKVLVTISIDGPKSIHDSNRIYQNGKGSFDDTEKGLKNLILACKNINAEMNFSFNMVTAGSNYEEIYNEIHKFISNTEWLPKNIPISCSLADMGPKKLPYILPQSKEEKEYFEFINEPLTEWTYNKKQNFKNETLFSDGDLNKRLLKIHKRLLFDKPIQEYKRNGCCIPGLRKVYVTVDEKFYPCERVGETPELGNLTTGFNIQDIKKFYFDDFQNEAKKYCKNCWAVNICALCYTNCFDKEKVNLKNRHEACLNERSSIELDLINYHSILEEKPEELSILNEIQVI